MNLESTRSIRSTPRVFTSNEAYLNYYANSMPMIDEVLISSSMDLMEMEMSIFEKPRIFVLAINIV
ncbi:MAG: hypothetical protein JL57_13650 [Desulfosporosinus sp. BICA1-9]|nr:MAG: hypothetical protein JL57_13650 [Desulfosporosinus sp. BICA1-9]